MATVSKEMSTINHTFFGEKLWGNQKLGENFYMGQKILTIGWKGLIVDRIELSSVKAGVINALFSSSKTPT